MGTDSDRAAAHVARVEEVYARVHDRMWRSLLAACRDPELASDAEAEAWAQALRRGDEIDDIERWTWKAALRILDGLLVRRPILDRSAPPEGVDVSILEFLDLLTELSPQQRIIVVLRYVAQFEPTEIAAVIDSTPGSVRVQLHRAHASLRASLETGGS